MYCSNKNFLTKVRYGLSNDSVRYYCYYKTYLNEEVSEGGEHSQKL